MASPSAGRVLVAGGTDWATLGRTAASRSDPNNLSVPHVLGPLKDVDVVFVASGPAACHCAAVDSQGRLWTWGRGENGQLGRGDRNNCNQPGVVDLPAKAVTVACGKAHTVVVLENGKCFSFGLNKNGQLGIGTLKMGKGVTDDTWVTPQECAVTDIAAVACGAEMTAFISRDGGLLTCGLPQYGQLGHGSDHSYNKAEGTVKIAYQPQPVPRLVSTFTDAGLKVARVACGHCHCVAITTCGRVFTWGDGGYGRLGTKDQKEQMKPVEVALPGGQGNRCPPDCVVAAAAHCTFLSAAQSQLWYCGKPKVSGEAAMYLKPFMELSGWKCRSMAAGPATYAVAAETSVATWGAAIAGELALGTGAKKTSASPELVTSLEGIVTLQVACGTGLTLFLVDKAADIAKLPIYDPPADAKAGGDKRKSGSGAEAAPKKAR